MPLTYLDDLRQSHGGMVLGADHSPRRAALASSSERAYSILSRSDCSPKYFQ